MTNRMCGWLGLALLASACGGGETTAPEATPAAAPVATAASAKRVFFVEPADGASVKSPVHFVFGVEGFTISPVPEGTVEHPREGMGHHHLGVDTNCLPEGAPIPKGTPGWIHFGKGDTTIDMQLTPGPHTFALQTGNDLHEPVAGLCQVLTITVEP
jgi:Domain of unknown function (DUF4399)